MPNKKIATVGQGYVYGKTVTVVRINGNINKIFMPEQIQDYTDHINRLMDLGYKIVEED